MLRPSPNNGTRSPTGHCRCPMMTMMIKNLSYPLTLEIPNDVPGGYGVQESVLCTDVRGTFKPGSDFTAVLSRGHHVV